ncbi:MAG TPA: molybdopterin converting factor subunit 1 [Patescibacteria group bacterium]|nr:molybdopterin converting factor subunit 1 [Patescibacteria group bacterium]
MKVTVIYFASIAEIVGMTRETLDLPEGSSVEDLIVKVGEAHAELASVERMLVAMNGEYVEPQTELGEGDEAALFPPVSGG